LLHSLRDSTLAELIDDCSCHSTFATSADVSYYQVMSVDAEKMQRQALGQVPLRVACELARISTRTARRAMARGELKPVGNAKSKRGKRTHLVWLYDVLQLNEPKNYRPVWVRFQEACRKHDHNPKLALAQMLWGCDGDPDLLHAGIRLTLWGGCFLDVLFDKVATDDSFDSFVALKLKKPLPPAATRRLDSQSFRVQWKNAQREVAKWTANTTPALVCYATGEAPKLMERPKYLQGFTGGVPSWTHESVRSVGRKLRGQYRMILRKLQDVTWEMRGPDKEPLQRNGMKTFIAATSAASAGNLNLAVKE
jgi:hypothetical protein